MKRNESNVPLCRFGPGGDFVEDWPERAPEPVEPAADPLRKVLSTIARMIGATLAPELITEVESANIVLTGLPTGSHLLN